MGIQIEDIKKKTISVAMATYNGEKFLRQQLESIYNQTLVPDEVVVSDDGSTDGTLKILEEYHKTNGLKYSINDGKHGCNHNFYRAISLCTSDVIAISDQDDIWLPNKIEVSFKKLCEIENGKPACVSSLCNHIDKDDNIISSTPDECDTKGYVATLMTNGNNQNRSQGCSLMFNKTLAEIIIEKNKMFPEIAETMFYDGFISFTAAIIGVKYNLGQKLMLYRHHSSNVLAKEGVKISLGSRIKQNNYFLFIPQRRIDTLPKMLEWYSKEEIINEAFELCSKISKISKVSTARGLFTIFQIKELNVFRKIIITIGSLVMYLIKKII